MGILIGILCFVDKGAGRAGGRGEARHEGARCGDTASAHRGR